MSDPGPDYTQPGTYIIPAHLRAKIEERIAQVNALQESLNVFTLGGLVALGFDPDMTTIQVDYQHLQVTVSPKESPAETPS